jgi:hypothetical protein
LKDNEVTLKNGTLNVAAESADKFYILVQNYADLTVTDMILDGTNLDKWSYTDGDSYTLSNNSGKVVINGKTTIIANNNGDLAFAFDACDKSAWGYELPTVTVADTVVINGNVEAAAVVNGTYYATFAQAYAEAKAGDTIVLLTPVVVTEDTVLDLTGLTIEAAGDTFVVEAGTLTLNGDGVVKAGTSGVGSWCAVWANGGHVIINGGTYSVGGDENSTDGNHQNDVIYTKKGGTVVINGGTFLNDGTVWTLNQNDSTGGKITVYGGTFYNWDPKNNVSEGADTSFVADGYCSIGKDNVYVVVVRPIGDISGDGQVTSLDVTLLKRYTAGYDVTIDLSMADIDGDGFVTILDATLLSRYKAGLLDKLPAQA